MSEFGESAETAVIVLEFEIDPAAEINPIQTVVEGLRDYFRDREPNPVGHIWVGTREYAQRVLAVQPERAFPPTQPTQPGTTP